jgi:hypothetical protein
MKFKIILLLLLSLCFSAFGLFEGKLKVSTSTRYGHDDNIFSQSVGSEIASDFISQVFVIQAVPIRSPKTNVAMFWSPEIRYRTIDDEILYFQNMVGMYSTKIGPRLSINAQNKFNISDKEPSLVNIVQDMYYYNNNTSVGLNYIFSRKDAVTLSLGHDMKVWSDNLQLSTNTFSNGSFDRTKVFGAWAHEFVQGKVFGSLGSSASTLEYEGERGGLDTAELYGRFDYALNPASLLSFQYGLKGHVVENEYGVSRRIKSPIALVSFMMQPTKDMSINASVSYDTFESSLPQFNMRESTKYSLGLRYKITPRINVSQNVMVMKSFYEEDFLRYEWEESSRDDLITVLMQNVTYVINPFHTIEGSWMLTKVNSFGTPEVLRNKLYVGYKFSF